MATQSNETVRVCEENLREEEAMADWLDHHLADVIHKYLSRASADVQAKV